MDDDQFSRWVNLLGSRIGIRTSAVRKKFLTNALDKRLQQINIQNYDNYYDYLQLGNKGKLEWAKLIDLLTVKETRFFRHSSSLHLLQDYAQEKLNNISNNSYTSSDKEFSNTIQVWSVGCATGEEAYTIAMILDQSIKQSKIKSCYYSVFASDISRASLSSARKGLYLSSQLNDIDPNLKSEYFLEQENGLYQIVDELKKRVCFTKTNVLNIEHTNIGQMDIIFCQNLLIYFEPATRVEILNRLVPHLAPNGLLILGAGEIHKWVNPELTLINSENILAYRKITAPLPTSFPRAFSTKKPGNTQ